MLAGSPQRLRRRGAAMILFTLMLAALIIPLAGLAIDVTKLYIVQAKLSAAVDGAALGSGRLLGTQANIEEIAREFLHANFPDKYWGSTLQEPTSAQIHYWKPTLNTHQIDIEAHADVPLWFLQIWQSTAPVSASATATRKDTRVVLVLDRTGSMTWIDPTTGKTVISAAINSAKYFTNMFTAGTDEMGLVVFSTSGIVAYPAYVGTRPYNKSPSSAGGPDMGFLTANGATYAQAKGPMMDTLGAIAAAGNTGMAEGLSLAYIEIQKAHNRDLALFGEDTRLNTIVLMTDGVPNQITVYLNNPAGTSISNASPCTYKTATGVTTTQMIGSMGNYFAGNGTYNGRPPATGVTGFWRLAWNDTNSTLNWVKQNGLDDTANITPTTPVNNCRNLPDSVGYSGGSASDLSRIPPTDYWGNSTGGNGYTHSYLVKNGAAVTPTVDNGTGYDPTKITSTTAGTAGFEMNAAAWNAVDNAGHTIRTDANIPIAIYTIGYQGTGGCDEGLLLRVANDPTCTCFDATQQKGRYVPAANSAQLQSAFNTVASEVLRLAK